MQRLWWVWFLGIEPRILQSRTFLLGASRADLRKFAPLKIPLYVVPEVHVLVLHMCTIASSVVRKSSTTSEMPIELVTSEYYHN